MEGKRRFRIIAISLAVIIIILGLAIFLTLNRKVSSELVEFVNTRTSLTREKAEKPELRTGEIDETSMQASTPEALPEPEAEKTSEKREETTSELTSPEPIATESQEELKQTPIERYVVNKHTVSEGESFSLVTGYYWEDIFLWPDLYVRNEMLSEDPDIIFPEETINIFNRLGQKDSYTPRETEEILKAYIEVYRVYKSLGDRKNNSVWTLLYCAAKYDHDFLDKYDSFIDPEDKEMAQKYIAEEGFLE